MGSRAGRATSLEERRFKAQLQLKDRALAVAAEGIAIADARLPDNPLIYVNAGFEKLTGYPADEVMGRNCRFLQGAETDAATLGQLRAALREQREITVQLLNRRKDGTTFWNRLSITPVRDSSGIVTHFIAVQSDVTAERNAQEELKRANEQLEAANRSLKQDLDAAAAVQRSLLPADPPEVPGIRFAWEFRPCQELAGDFLNVLQLDEHHVGVYILDVSGHGVAAALLSVTLSHVLSPVADRSFLYQAVPETPGAYRVTPPADVVARLNKHFRMGPRALQYFTMVYGVMDTRTREFRFVTAGHPGPVLACPGRAPEVLEASGIPVGLLPDADYEERVVRLRPGDRLYLATDGLTEAENAAGEEFGAARLLEACGQNRNRPLDESLQEVVSRVEQWCAPAHPGDDVAMLAIECEP
ncbi:MAG TPA: SpoIIE family protein phosphatase [Bryobacteraceae bacterium]|nr:SpoIIE family protein phosphatase [Bryobacteraceae bacterium]